MIPQPVEGLPYWLVLVLFAAIGSPALLSKTAAKLPGAFGALGRWAQSRKPESKASAAYERQEQEIERLSQQYDRIADDYRELNHRMDQLEEELNGANRKFFDALGYVRRLVDVIRRLDADHEIPEPPTSLQEYM